MNARTKEQPADSEEMKSVPKLNCWEFKKCGREPGGANADELGICPAATDTSSDGINGGKNAGRTCWSVAGTFCGGEVQGTFAQKRTGCLNCDLFEKVLEEEGYKIETSNINLNECLDNTLQIIWGKLKDTCRLKKEYGKLPITNCCSQQLKQAFVNLLLNAAQSIEKQGEIKIKTWNNSGYNYISISDNGRGIPKDQLNKIFDPFFTTREADNGTGLGLRIVYDIIKKHNGTIEVDSEVGRGTTVTVGLPVT